MGKLQGELTFVTGTESSDFCYQRGHYSWFWLCDFPSLTITRPVSAVAQSTSDLRDCRRQLPLPAFPSSATTRLLFSPYPEPPSFRLWGPLFVTMEHSLPRLLMVTAPAGRPTDMEAEQALVSQFWGTGPLLNEHTLHPVPHTLTTHSEVCGTQCCHHLGLIDVKVSPQTYWIKVCILSQSLGGISSKS